MVDNLRERRTKKHSLIKEDKSKEERQRNLFFYHELDDWQKDNHYIRSSYVKETLSFSRSFKSLFYLHNESVNIYSHLIPALLILCVIFVSFQWEPLTWENAILLQFAIGAHTCLSSSAYFHLFKSHSARVCKLGNQCDYFGIVVMITTSLISIIMFAFDDKPTLKYGFVVTFFILATLCTIVTFDSKFSTPEYRPFRSSMFIMFGLSGVLPIIAAVSVYGYEEAIRRSGANWLVLEGFFYILGAILYAMRVPEKFTHNESHVGRNIAGKLDLFGHSHQIFHFMVLIAAWCHWNALTICHSIWLVRTNSDSKI